jgi:Cft2 family RNA processing exonuclease
MNQEQLIYYLTGFADGEGCFCIALKNQKSAKVRWVLDPIFHVTQNAKSKDILYQFQKLLNCGIVIKKYGQPDTMQFVVQSRRELVDKVIPFFRKYKLTTKNKDFEIFAEVVEALDNHKHADKEEFKKLLKKVFMMNGEGKQRRYKFEDVIKSLESSETIRQTRN